MSSQIRSEFRIGRQVGFHWEKYDIICMIRKKYKDHIIIEFNSAFSRDDIGTEWIIMNQSPFGQIIWQAFFELFFTKCRIKITYSSKSNPKKNFFGKIAINQTLCELPFKSLYFAPKDYFWRYELPKS